MQVITPVEVTDSKLYSSTIAEPDSTQGEASWVAGRASSFDLEASSDIPYAIAVLNDTVYIIDATDSRVEKYSTDGEYIGAAGIAASSTVRGMTTDGVYIYTLSSSASVSTPSDEATVTKYSESGAPAVSSITLYFSQTATSANRALCFANGLLYVYSRSDTHNTVSAFNPSVGGDPLFEYDVQESFSDLAVLSMTAYDSYIYVLCTSGQVYKCDQAFSSVELNSSTVLLGSRYPVGLFYDEDNDLFWSTSGVTAGVTGCQYGFLNNDLTDMAGIYRTGEQAIKKSTHRIYQAASDTTDDPEVGVLKTPPTWVDIGATNKFRAFDHNRGERAIASADEPTIVYVIDPVLSFSSLAVFNMANVKSVTLTIFEPGNSTAIYNETINLTDISTILSMWDYFDYTPEYDDFAIFDGLTVPKFSRFYLTISGSDSVYPAEVGEIVFGDGKTIGTVVSGTSTDRKSYSTIETDDYGNDTVVKRPSASYTTFSVAVNTANMQYVERVLKDVLDVATLFIGDDLNGDQIAEFGYYERSPLTRSNPSIATLNIKVRGLV